MPKVETLLLRAMHAGFFALLLASTSRLVVNHGLNEGTAVKLGLAGGLGVLYAAGALAWNRLPHRARVAWLIAVIACWLWLVELAPSFGWCAMPLFFVSLRLLPPKYTAPVVVVLTAAVIFAQVRLSHSFDPSLVLGPLAVAGTTAVIFVVLQKLINDLTRTRDELATAQRAAGVLEERERLAREIHDTLAQGLTSMGMLLQAAGRAWDSDPGVARKHVERAAETATTNLEEARRFVRALVPYDLAAGSLPTALRSLAERSMIPVQVRQEGLEFDLTAAQQEALLRVAQGALANVREHAHARNVMITLSYLDDAVTLDIFDDGTGFDPGAVRSATGRGFGLRAMRDRLQAVGGTLSVESHPGDGTAIAATIRKTS